MNAHKARRTVFALAAAVSLGTVAACTQPHSGDTYSASELGRPMTLERATVLAVRPVRVERDQSMIGSGAGAIMGGAGGSMIGGNDTVNVIGAVGGAVLGGLIGSAAERGVTGDTALEITVQTADGDVFAVVQGRDRQTTFQPGQRVMIVKGDRLRVVPDTGLAAVPEQPPALSAFPSAATAQPVSPTWGPVQIIDGRPAGQPE